MERVAQSMASHSPHPTVRVPRAHLHSISSQGPSSRRSVDCFLRVQMAISNQPSRLTALCAVQSWQMAVSYRCRWCRRARSDCHRSSAGLRVDPADCCLHVLEMSFVGCRSVPPDSRRQSALLAQTADCRLLFAHVHLGRHTCASFGLRSIDRR